MGFATRPLHDFDLYRLTDTLNAAFEDYVISIQFTPAIVSRIMRCEGIDLLSSRLLTSDGDEAGVALISRRGRFSRVAAMGLRVPYRGQGGGRVLLQQVVGEAHFRRDHTILLECIAGNFRAEALYESVGFTRVRRLAGFLSPPQDRPPSEDIEEIDLLDAARLIGAGSVSDAPWMLTGEALAYVRAPADAYRLGRAAAIVVPQGEEACELKGLTLSADAGVQGETGRLVQEIVARYPGRRWHAGPFFPQELIGRLMTSAGFVEMELAQHEYRLDLDAPQQDGESARS